jgi:large subunit ribosomal protein L25
VTQQQSAEQLEAELAGAEAEAGIVHEESDAESAETAAAEGEGDADGAGEGAAEGDSTE